MFIHRLLAATAGFLEESKTTSSDEPRELTVVDEK